MSGKVQEDEVVDSNVLQYCSIDGKKKKSIGEMEQEFLQALQVTEKNILDYYYYYYYYLVSKVVCACSYLWL
jgi:hypothetical protein